jgi:hypothetical protein
VTNFDPSVDPEISFNTLTPRSSGVWPVLLVLAIATLGVSVYRGYRFNSSCHQLECLGLVIIYAAVAASCVACGTAGLGWGASKPGTRRLLTVATWIAIAVAWLAIVTTR